MLWPSHKGGINFRKNRFNDRFDYTLKEIQKYYSNIDKTDFIPDIDKPWFDYLGHKFPGDGFNSFCHCFSIDQSIIDITNFNEYNYQTQLSVYINNRTNEMLKYLI